VGQKTNKMIKIMYVFKPEFEDKLNIVGAKMEFILNAQNHVSVSSTSILNFLDMLNNSENFEDFINNAFFWELSNEGYKYWENISKLTDNPNIFIVVSTDRLDYHPHSRNVASTFNILRALEMARILNFGNWSKVFDDAMCYCKNEIDDFDGYFKDYRIELFMDDYYDKVTDDRFLEFKQIILNYSSHEVTVKELSVTK